MQIFLVLALYNVGNKNSVFANETEIRSNLQRTNSLNINELMNKAHPSFQVINDSNAAYSLTENFYSSLTIQKKAFNESPKHSSLFLLNSKRELIDNKDSAAIINIIQQNRCSSRQDIIMHISSLIIEVVFVYLWSHFYMISVVHETSNFLLLTLVLYTFITSFTPTNGGFKNATEISLFGKLQQSFQYAGYFWNTECWLNLDKQNNFSFYLVTILSCFLSLVLHVLLRCFFICIDINFSKKQNLTLIQMIKKRNEIIDKLNLYYKKKFETPIRFIDSTKFHPHATEQFNLFISKLDKVQEKSIWACNSLVTVPFDSKSLYYVLVTLFGAENVVECTILMREFARTNFRILLFKRKLQKKQFINYSIDTRIRKAPILYKILIWLANCFPVLLIWLILYSQKLHFYTIALFSCKPNTNIQSQLCFYDSSSWFARYKTIYSFLVFNLSYLAYFSIVAILLWCLYGKNYLHRQRKDYPSLDSYLKNNTDCFYSGLSSYSHRCLKSCGHLKLEDFIMNIFFLSMFSTVPSLFYSDLSINMLMINPKIKLYVAFIIFQAVFFITKKPTLASYVTYSKSIIVTQSILIISQSLLYLRFLRDTKNNEYNTVYLTLAISHIFFTIVASLFLALQDVGYLLDRKYFLIGSTKLAPYVKNKVASSLILSFLVRTTHIIYYFFLSWLDCILRYYPKTNILTTIPFREKSSFSINCKVYESLMLSSMQQALSIFCCGKNQCLVDISVSRLIIRVIYDMMYLRRVSFKCAEILHDEILSKINVTVPNLPKNETSFIKLKGYDVETLNLNTQQRSPEASYATKKISNNLTSLDYNNDLMSEVVSWINWDTESAKKLVTKNIQDYRASGVFFNHQTNPELDLELSYSGLMYHDLEIKRQCISLAEKYSNPDSFLAVDISLNDFSYALNHLNKLQKTYIDELAISYYVKQHEYIEETFSVDLIEKELFERMNEISKSLINTDKQVDSMQRKKYINQVIQHFRVEDQFNKTQKKLLESQITALKRYLENLEAPDIYLDYILNVLIQSQEPFDLRRWTDESKSSNVSDHTTETASLYTGN